MPRFALLLALASCAAHVQWPVPEGWSSSGATLTAPNDEVRVHRFETTEPDPERAARAAWANVHGDDQGLALASGPVRWPPSRGWETEVSLTFSSGKTHVRAEVRGLAGTSYVVLAEGDEAALARREGQVDAVVQGLTPKGMRDESFAGQPRRPLDRAAFDAFLADAVARLEVPGAAVAVVQGGQVVYEKVLGVRELGASEAVTGDTLFMVGSVTKPMTTMLEAALVDAKVLTWSTPVTTLLPTFKVDDAELTRAAAVAHVVCVHGHAPAGLRVPLRVRERDSRAAGGVAGDDEADDEARRGVSVLEPAGGRGRVRGGARVRTRALARRRVLARDA